MHKVSYLAWLLVAVLANAQMAHAANHALSEKSVYIVAQSSVDTSKNWVFVNGLTKQDGSAHACGASGAYFEANDKEIAAVLLNSQMNGYPVDIYYQDGATSVNLSTGGTCTCRLLAAWID